MTILKKLGIRRILSDKKTAILTVSGIMLSVALITMILVSSSAGYEVAYRAQMDSSKIHNIEFKTDESPAEVLGKLSSVEAVYTQTYEGYYEVIDQEQGQRYSHSVFGFDPQDMIRFESKKNRDTAFRVVAGREAQNANEIAISLIKAGDESRLKLGDVISLYADLNEDSQVETSSYLRDVVVVGFTVNSQYASQTRASNSPLDYTTYLKFYDDTQNYDELLQIVKSHTSYKTGSNIKGGMDEGAIHYDLYENYERNVLLGFSRSPNFLRIVISGLAGVFVSVVALASMIIIYNAFNVSQDQKVYQSGLIRSIGTTRKQIKVITYVEGFILGVIGLILGVLLGTLMAYLMISIVIGNLSTIPKMDFVDWSYTLPYKDLLLVGIVTLIIVYIPLRLSIRKLFKMTSIESIRKQNRYKSREIKSSRSRVLRSKRVTTRLAAQNVRRDKRKYRGTIVALVTSMVLLIVTASFISNFVNVLSLNRKLINYNITVTGFGDLEPLQEELDQYLADHHEIEARVAVRELSTHIKRANLESLELNARFPASDDDRLSFDTRVLVFTDAEFKRYTESLNLDVNAGEVMMVNWYEGIQYDYREGSYIPYAVQSEIVDLAVGDFIKLGTYVDEETPSLKIVASSSSLPFGLDGDSDYQGIVLYFLMSESLLNQYQDLYLSQVDDTLVSDNHGNEVPKRVGDERSATIYLKSKDRSKTIASLKAFTNSTDAKEAKYFKDHFEDREIEQSIILSINQVMKISMSLVILMSLTNVINIALTNARLRTQEFAILKSSGMTPKQLQVMLFKESLLMMYKPLILSSVISIGISYMLFRAIDYGSIPPRFSPDYGSIVVSWLLVLVVLVLNSVLAIRVSRRVSIVDELKQIE